MPFGTHNHLHLLSFLSFITFYLSPMVFLGLPSTLSNKNVVLPILLCLFSVPFHYFLLKPTFFLLFVHLPLAGWFCTMSKMFLNVLWWHLSHLKPMHYPRCCFASSPGLAPILCRWKVYIYTTLKIPCFVCLSYLTLWSVSLLIFLSFFSISFL